METLGLLSLYLEGCWNLVDSLGLGPSVERRTGSSPVPFTKKSARDTCPIMEGVDH